MRKWMIGAAVAAVLAIFGATALAQQDASTRETARAPSTEQEKTGSKTGVEVFLPPDLAWEDNPAVPGVQNAAGVGDPTKPQLYTSFGKMEEGTRFPAHTHPDARITTVLSGTMYYRVGERSSRVEFEPYPAGSVIYTPPGVPHVMWAKDGEIVVQETGRGPTDLEFTYDEER
jgi:quercetin dioxygenase-like cupin family protein